MKHPTPKRIAKRCAEFVRNAGGGNMATGAKIIGIAYYTAHGWESGRTAPDTVSLQRLRQAGADLNEIFSI